MVGTVDGTHLGLEIKPPLYGEDYFTWKSKDGVVAMVVNDDKKCIHYLNIGCPASIHDERVWSKTAIAHNPNTYFPPDEYLLVNSAFSNYFYIVSAFKKLGNQVELEKDQSTFNRALSTGRVKKCTHNLHLEG